ncbi:response regulator transcription factor [Aequorivita sp. H23M31]|uniref:Response regulator transcription factor n=1 Tax=Aequorivita ciconiae TaxID=2494375 RepID=A0A410G658_9FLAO|nr:response regulator transcription factor [Aequorivita sp. H23M31]QAA82675.1 response regulator transcription factor [Aequorivita sp. H23M31]
MFKRVLLSEDIDTISQGIMAVMDKLHIEDVQQTQYCDDTYLRIKKSNIDGFPIDLLITDLSFVPDHRKQEINSGEELIKKVRKEFPELKIIVYSIEDRPERVRSLLRDFKVDGYVAKGRRGLRELEDAIISVINEKIYLSPSLNQTIRSQPPVEIIDFDIELLRLLSKGHSQDQISAYLKEKSIKPCSLSALEKRLNILRHHFGANNVVHLVSITKDLGII